LGRRYGAKSWDAARNRQSSVYRRAQSIRAEFNLSFILSTTGESASAWGLGHAFKHRATLSIAFQRIFQRCARLQSLRSAQRFSALCAITQKIIYCFVRAALPGMCAEEHSMTTGSRRQFLQIASAGAACAALVSFTQVNAAAGEPVLGMIFPPAHYPVPPEAKLLYPMGVTFLAEGVGLEAMSPEGYDHAVPKILPAAEKLAKAGATAISIMGTSLTFYKGAAYNQELIDAVAKATGLPATSMSNGIVDGLRTAGAKRVAVATAYNDVVNATLQRFLEESGFVVQLVKGLNIVRMRDRGPVTQDELLHFSAGVYDMAANAKGGADALLISCGGLKTIDLLVPLEAQCKVPVVSSTPHALMNAVKLVGLSGRAQGYGSVLAKA
jgi:arylmalonate decarboxylase